MCPYLIEMRDYMPPEHRSFIERLECGPDLRRYVAARKESHPSLREVYNTCVDWLVRFRSKHLEYAALYIQRQGDKPGQLDHSNLTDVGTGGTPFMPYLRKHRDETSRHLVT